MFVANAVLQQRGQEGLEWVPRAEEGRTRRLAGLTENCRSVLLPMGEAVAFCLETTLPDSSPFCWHPECVAIEPSGLAARAPLSRVHGPSPLIADPPPSFLPQHGHTMIRRCICRAQRTLSPGCPLRCQAGTETCGFLVATQPVNKWTGCERLQS